MEGTLDAEGRLVLDGKPGLPPGRVRVALQTLESTASIERLPDEPLLDAMIPAPIDLPYEAKSTPIQSRFVAKRLPEVPTLTDFQK